MAVGKKVVKYGAVLIILGLIGGVARRFIGRLIEGPPPKGVSGRGDWDSGGEVKGVEHVNK